MPGKGSEAAAGSSKSGDVAAPRPKATMVVPMYNEEELIGAFLSRSEDDLGAVCGDGYEILVVDDGSTDNSAEILGEFCRRNGRLRALSLGRNTGIANATIAGLREARGEIVFWNTVDRVIDTRECLTKALEALGKGWDAASFYRENLEGNTLYQKILTMGNVALIRALFPWRFRAYQQFQFHRSDFVRKVVFESEGYFLVPELLFKAKASGLKICEMPAVYHGRGAGKAKGGRLKWVMRTWRDIIRLWFRWIVLKRPLLFRDSPV